MSSVVSSTSSKSTTTIANQDTTVTDYNLVSLTANTEYSQALPANCKGFWIKTKLPCTLKTSFVLNGTHVTPMTVPPLCVYREDQFFSNSTIYFQTSIGSVIVELRAFS